MSRQELNHGAVLDGFRLRTRARMFEALCGLDDLYVKGRELWRQLRDTRAVVLECSQALTLAAGVLMRPTDGELDEELLAARMAVLRAQDAAGSLL